jgi:hypothetical protein
MIFAADLSSILRDDFYSHDAFYSLDFHCAFVGRHLPTPNGTFRTHISRIQNNPPVHQQTPYCLLGVLGSHILDTFRLLLLTFLFSRAGMTEYNLVAPIKQESARRLVLFDQKNAVVHMLIPTQGAVGQLLCLAWSNTICIATGATHTTGTSRAANTLRGVAVRLFHPVHPMC